MKIKTKSLLSHLSASVVAVVLIAILSFVAVRGILGDLVAEQLDSVSTETRVRLELQLNEAARDLSAWSRLFSMQDVLIEDKDRSIQVELYALKDRFPLFAELFAVSEEGVVVSSTAEWMISQDVREAQFFVNAMTGDAYQGDVEQSPYSGRQGIIFAVPIRADYDPDSVIGVLAGVIDWKTVRRYIDGLTVLGQAQGGDRGLMIYSPESASFLYRAHGLNADNAKDQLLNLFQNDTGTRELTVGDRTLVIGLDSTSGDIGFRNPGWLFFAVVDADVANESIYRMGRYFLIFGLITIAFAAVLGYWAANHLTEPITSLTAAMKRVAGGDMDVNLRLANRSDEIGEMAGVIQVFKDQVIEMERLAREKAEAEAEGRMLLSDTVGGLVQAVGVWDEEDRFVLSNSQFEKLVSLRQRPTLKMKKGISFEHYIRSLASAGWFPYRGDELEKFIRQRLQNHFSGDGLFDVPRADGTTLRIIEKRTDNGRTVVTCFDITEFKRREEAMSILVHEHASGGDFVMTALQALTAGLGGVLSGIALHPQGGRGRGVVRLWNSRTHLEVPAGDLSNILLDAIGAEVSKELPSAAMKQLGDVLGVSALSEDMIALIRLRGENSVPVGYLFTIFDRRTEISDESDQLHRMIAGWVEAQFERHLAEESLRKVTSAIEQSPASVVITDIDGRIEYVNPKFISVTGYNEGEVVGQNPRVLKSGQTSDDQYKELWTKITSGEIWRGEFLNRRKDGTTFWESATISPVRNAEEEITHFIAVKEDITVRKEYEERLLRQANFDELTGLPNRVLAFDRLGQALATAHRQNHNVAVMFVGLDQFKNVNDTLGHETGDNILREMAQRLSRSVGEGDTVARFEGDEFIVVLPEVEQGVAAEVVARNIVRTFAEPLTVLGKELFLTASIGISLYPGDSENPHILQQNAEAAMYQAKATGRNKWRFFTPDMNERAKKRVTLESLLRRAIDRNEFTMNYHPFIDAQTGELMGAEALIRWNNEELGFVPPDQFIPVAEDTNLIVPIGEWVLRQSCDDAAKFTKLMNKDFVVGVNVATNQLRGTSFLDIVASALSNSGLKPGQVEIEITERLFVDGHSSASFLPEALREMGLRLAIDDFGTGYSSLSYLTRFPLTTLKIDRAFIRDLEEGEGNVALVQAILAMAKNLKLDVVAEGVETAAQIDFLRREGCNILQGFYFTKPLPFDAFADYIATYDPKVCNDAKG